MKAPSDYIGPSVVFGTALAQPDETEKAGLPLVREIRDEQSWIPTAHKKDFVPGPIPPSLRTRSAVIRPHGSRPTCARAGPRYIIPCSCTSLGSSLSRSGSTNSFLAKFIRCETDCDTATGTLRIRFSPNWKTLWEDDFVSDFREHCPTRPGPAGGRSHLGAGRCRIGECHRADRGPAY